MLHEVILALLGHPGSIIQEAKEPNATHGLSNITFRVQDSITFLTATERAAINRLVGVGSTYRDLRRFVRPHPLNWVADASSPHKKDLSDSNGEGLYVRALKLGVEELLDEYGTRIAQVESDVMRDPTSTLARVHAAIREVSMAVRQKQLGKWHMLSLNSNSQSCHLSSTTTRGCTVLTAAALLQIYLSSLSHGLPFSPPKIDNFGTNLNLSFGVYR